MRTKILKISILILFALCFTPAANSQHQAATDNIIGMDLEQVERIYRRALSRGDSSLTIHYAEKLFIQSEFERAFEMYERADALGQVETIQQKRNYQHSALRIDKQSPYVQNTGYFSKRWNLDVNINPFCSNSPQEDFAPFFWKGILFLTSSRDLSEEQYLFTRNPFLNVFAFLHDCISTQLPDALPPDINTQRHDGPIAISEDGNLLIITRNHQEKSNEGIYNLYLDYYVKKGNQWSNSRRFPLFDKEFSVQHPYYSDKDSTLYFSSNVEGGYGGFDLYKSKWNGQRWSEPENLGPEINSPYDEVFPAFAPWGDLIYSSNHIETYGGLDLVMFRDEIRYLFPKPFNTVHDDFSITFKTESSGYIASNRDIQGFTDDIYVFDITGPLWPLYDFYVEVLDKETLEPIEGVEVIFSSEIAEGDLNTTEKGMGFLHTGTREFFDYSFSLYKDGYLPKDTVSDFFVEKDGDFILTLLLEQVYPEGQFVVYFDNDRPDPRSRESVTDLTYEQTFNAYMSRIYAYYNNSINTREEIDNFFDDVQQGMENLTQLAQFLREEFEKDRHYIITFTSHASPLATSEYNLILSKRRFVSVENFLKSWEEGQLRQFVEQGNLQYVNNPLGASLARPDVSDDRLDIARSVYSIAAARERRVTISWRRIRAGDAEQGYLNGFPIVPYEETTEQYHQEEEITAPDPITDDDKAELPLATQPERNYHIIVASFSNLDNAQNKAKRLQGLYGAEASVLPISENMLYRVSYHSYGNRQDAEAALRKVRSNIAADAWILIR